MAVVELARPFVQVEEEYLTLSRAAEIAGHSAPRALQLAARRGDLKTIRLSARVQFTTQAWLDDYLAGRWERKPRGTETDDNSVDE